MEGMAAKPPPLTEDEKQLYRSMLRTARDRSSADAEAVHDLLVAIERLGARLHAGHASGLAAYKGKLADLARGSGHAEPTSKAALKFTELFELVRKSRNEFVHHGAVARLLVRQVVEMTITLEDALMVDLDQVKHAMVRSPVCAEAWMHLADIRQTMLENGFSALPYLSLEPPDAPRWRLVTDVALACFLPRHGTERRNRFRLTLKEAIDSGLELEFASKTKPDDKLLKVVKGMGPGKLAVVLHEERLVGIVTSFDVL